MNKTFLDLKRGISLYRVWTYAAYHELTAKYRRTFLGSLWIAGSMVVTSLCLSLVFGTLMGQDLRQVLPHIMAGILCFSLVSFILIDGPEVFLRNSGNIQNHAYPFSYYVFESMTKEIFLFLHNLIVYYIAMVLIGAATFPHWTILIGLPIVVITGTCWGSVFGILAARFRDMRFMLPYVNQMLFFITPIFWTVDHSKKSLLAYGNPYYGLLEMMRSPLMGEIAPPICWELALGTLVSGIIVWLIVFSTFRRRIPFWV